MKIFILLNKSVGTTELVTHDSEKIVRKIIQANTEHDREGFKTPMWDIWMEDQVDWPKCARCHADHQSNRSGDKTAQ